MKPRDNPGGYYRFYAELLVANGYSVVAVKPGTKRPRHRRWQTGCFKLTDPVFLHKHSYGYPNDSVAIACGTRVIAIDIDADDQELADRIHQIARETLGDTPLVRFGKPPRRALLYRPTERINTTRHGKVEIFGVVGTIMAYGKHPGTGMPYHWLGASPVDTPVERLPPVTPAAVEAFLTRVGQATGRGARVHPVPAPANDTRPTIQDRRARTRSGTSGLLSGVTYDSRGKVVDGRDSFLAYLAMREYAIGFTNPERLAGRIWQLFLQDADQTRPKGSSANTPWAYSDALKKAQAVSRKFADRPVIRHRPGAHPVRHLHSYRRRGFWTDDRKAKHQAEAGYRISAPSALAVNRAMLAATSLAGGQCEITVGELMEQIKVSESAVKGARRRLLEAGLWIAQRGVYVPFPLENLESDQVTDSAADQPSRVQSHVHPLYHREVVSSAAIVAEPANDDGTEDKLS